VSIDKEGKAHKSNKMKAPYYNE